ncbi:MAG: hypothetical protein MJY79_07490 [Bacteroidaceae bacterium]|nr:hypothetical protein [Bacteroidaceae bacterium]
MRKYVLLFLLTLSMRMSASVLQNYGFERSQDASAGVSYLCFDSIYSTYEVISDPYGIIDVFNGYGGTSFLKVKTYGTAEPFGRFQLDGLDLKAGESYRVSFYAKAAHNSLVEAQVLSSDSRPLLSQEMTVTSDRWNRYVFVFRLKADAKCSLALDFLSADTEYLLDEVTVQTSSVASVDYAGDMVRVDFGYETNMQELLKRDHVHAIYPDPSCMTISSEGHVFDIVSVEYHEDGYLYAWVDDDLNPYQNIKVSFRNPDSDEYHLLYRKSGSGDIPGFENESASYSDRLMAISYYQMPPIMITSDPDDGSFNLTDDVRSFHVLFYKSIYTEIGVITAVLRGSSFEEVLSFDSISANGRELWFSRTGNSVLNGDYMITVTGCRSYSGGAVSTHEFSVSYGEILATHKVYLKTDFVHGTAGTIPVGFHVIDNAGDKANGESSSGGRLMAFTPESDIQMGIYWGPRSGSSGGSLFYGDERSGSRLSLPPGTYTISFPIVGWESYRPEIESTVYQRNNPSTVILSRKFTPTHDATRGTYFKGADFLEFGFSVSEASDYVLKWFIPYSSDKPWNSAAIGDILLQSNSSVAEKYQEMLSAALDDAKATVARASGSEAYACSLVLDLNDVIQTYIDWKSTSPKAFNAAVDQLNTLSASLNHRMEQIDLFLEYRSYAEQMIAQHEGGSYSELSGFRLMKEAVAQFSGVDVATLETEVIEEAVIALERGNRDFKDRVVAIDRLKELLGQASKTMEKYQKYRYDIDYLAIQSAYERYSRIDVIKTEDRQFYGFVNDLQSLLDRWADDVKYTSIRTKQISDLKALAASLNVDYAGLGNQIGNLATLVDDQQIAEIYKLAIKARIYEVLATKRETQFDLTSFMQNAALYTEYDANQSTLIHQCAKSPYPGWSVIDGWGNDYVCTSAGPSNANAQASYTNKVVDSGIGLDWGAGIILSQTLTCLPVGRYSLNAKMGAWGNVDNRVGTISFTQTDALGSTSTSSIPFEGKLEELELRALTDRVSLTLDFRTNGTWIFVDYLTFTFKGGLVGHDYAADVESARRQFTEALTDVTPVASECESEYYDLNGRRIEEPVEGISIRRTRMNDGSYRSDKIFK